MQTKKCQNKTKNTEYISEFVCFANMKIVFLSWKNAFFFLTLIHPQIAVIIGLCAKQILFDFLMLGSESCIFYIFKMFYLKYFVSAENSTHDKQ